MPAEPFGIGNAEFNAGLKESKYGYPVMELYELVHLVATAEMKSRWEWVARLWTGGTLSGIVGG